MKTINILMLALAAVMGMALTACDPMSSVEYRIYNLTDDTVTISFYDEIMTSSFQGYTLEENDSVTTRFSPSQDNDSCLVAVLAPKRSMWAQYEWSGLYREEFIVPMWRYIKTITVGAAPLDSAKWGNESPWTLKVTGGKRFQGESRYYQLLVRTK